MLWACSDITRFTEFKKVFEGLNPNTEFVDLSRIQSSLLQEHAESILSHHQNAAIFLGYLEPGWMLAAHDQTLMRELFRKFPVGFVFDISESLPFSWKNEIEVLYG